MAVLFSNDAFNAIKMLGRGFAAGFIEELRGYRALLRYARIFVRTGDQRAAGAAIGEDLKRWYAVYKEMAGMPRGVQRAFVAGRVAAQGTAFWAAITPLYAPIGIIHRYASGGSMFRDEHGRRDVAFLPFF